MGLENLSGPQARALAALMTTASVQEAAEMAGLSERTVYRYLSSETFQDALRAARRAAIQDATGVLQGATAEAVSTLRRNLHSGKAPTEVRAAQIILDAAMKAAELQDLEERLARLEEMASREGSRWE